MENKKERAKGGVGELVLGVIVVFLITWLLVSFAGKGEPSEDCQGCPVGQYGDSGGCC